VRSSDIQAEGEEGRASFERYSTWRMDFPDSGGILLNESGQQILKAALKILTRGG